jgi:hypothetical protein
MIYRRNGEGYEVLAYHLDGSMRTIGFVMRYGPRWSAVDTNEKSETFSTRKMAGRWLLAECLAEQRKVK